jgi:Ca2+-binding RTX toxin-like protein
MLESLETLESRRLLSVTLDDGVLTVTGTEQDDQLGVGRSPTMIVVNDNGTSSEWDPALVQSIVVNALGGNDQVAVVRPVMKPLTANGGAGDDALRGSIGRERFNGEAGNDRLFGGGGGDLLDGGADNDVLVGGAGPDRMLGGDGDDRFDAVDRDMDQIDGGAGEDGARVNRGDRAHNVEHVFVWPRPPSNTSAIDEKTDDAIVRTE